MDPSSITGANAEQERDAGESGPQAGDTAASSRTKRQGRILPLSRKKTESPPQDSEDDKSDHPSDDEDEDSLGHEDESQELAPVDSKNTATSEEDEEFSQEINEDRSGSDESTEDEDDLSEGSEVLEARLPTGTLSAVSLIVGEEPYEYDNESDFDSSAAAKLSRSSQKYRASPTETATDASMSNGHADLRKSRSSKIPTVVGHDGNLFYCHVCKDFGDVVCCDGCPHVYHPTCIPEGSASRTALDNDEDPWFCPECMTKHMAKHNRYPPSSRRVGGKERRTVKRICCECQQSGGDTPMEPCEGCGVYMHHPSCRVESEDNDEGANAGPLCSNCQAEEVLIQEEGALAERKRKR